MMMLVVGDEKAVILRSERSEPRRTAAARTEHASFETPREGARLLRMTVECLAAMTGSS
jgi:hypothetical protein